MRIICPIYLAFYLAIRRAPNVFLNITFIKGRLPFMVKNNFDIVHDISVVPTQQNCVATFFGLL